MSKTIFIAVSYANLKEGPTSLQIRADFERFFQLFADPPGTCQLAIVFFLKKFLNKKK